MFIVVYQLTFS